MATFFPKQQPEEMPLSERLTWRALEALPDPWRVFYSVGWQGLRHGREGDGEADFVLFHPQRGIVILEVKGGSISVVDGEWFTVPYGGGAPRPIRNPYQQASDSKHALLRKLSELPIRRLPTVCHAVVFTSGEVGDDIGLIGPRAITICESDLVDVPAAVEGVLRHWEAKASLTLEEATSVTRLLAPTVTIRTGLRAAIAASEKQLVELTNQQLVAVNGLRRSRRTVILGGPGTGKTIVAVHRARELEAQGGRVLLTCFNQPLAARLTTELADTQVDVMTFHSLCLREAHRAGIEVPTPIADSWWEVGAADVLLQSIESSPTSCDAILVDEGQDFLPDWLTSLELMLADPAEGIFTLFADEHQAIFRSGWLPTKNATEYVLGINCRSTGSIVKRVNAIIGSMDANLGTKGPAPVFVSVASLDEAVEDTQQTVARLVDDEFLEPTTIAVLCETRNTVDRLRSLSGGSTSFVEPGKAGVVAETIHRFKGLESETVVVLFEGTNDLAADPSLAYVGLSRARSMLVVIGPKSLKQTLRWSG
jgi:RecA/RadA recombinase